MLRVRQSSDSSHAKSYFTKSDYYLGNEQELPGLWRGEGARRLGLSGEVQKDAWDALCENRNPNNGVRLTSRQRADRTIGYDFTFDVPKSVSLLYAETQDDRILNAFRDAVHETMKDIESEAQVRVRKDGKDENRMTGNLVWGEFTHFTSRPVQRIPDPNLHAHCFVQNISYDAKESKWKAGQFREHKQDAPYFESLFSIRLAHKLSELGLPIDRTRKEWELAGIDRTLVNKFSRRTAQIEARAKELGIEDPKIKSELGARTREAKRNDLTFSQLRELWRERMTSKEREAIDRLAERIGSGSRPTDSGAAARAIEFAIEHEFERRSVVPERMLLARAMKQAAGRTTPEQVMRAYKRANLIHSDRNGQRFVTTRQVLKEEMKLVAYARDGRGRRRPFTLTKDWMNRPGVKLLNEDQRNAVRHILESRDRVLLLRGKAGVGKTTLLQEARDIIESNGQRVFAFAPSSKTSRDVLRKDGFKADTVAMLLQSPQWQTLAAGNVIIIDEAGQVGTRTLSKVFELAERIDARLILSGDRYQHRSIERGDGLRLLEEEAGLKSADVKEIRRQSGDYKEAVKAISEGRIGDGFKRLDDLGWIKEIPGEDRHRQVAKDYIDAFNQGKTTLLIAPTHLEGDRLTKEVRRQLREQGTLKGKEHRLQILASAHLTEAERGDSSSYVVGRNILVFHQNAKGFKRGQRVEVTSDASLPLDQRQRFDVFRKGELSIASGDLVRITRNGYSLDGKHRLDNGMVYQIKGFDKEGHIVLKNGWTISKDYGFLDYGHVSTSYASQGSTVQRVFVSLGYESLPATGREQFYVSVSRAKEKATIYVGNKTEMLEAIERTEPRLSAHELVGRHGLPPLTSPWSREVKQNTPAKSERQFEHER